MAYNTASDTDNLSTAEQRPRPFTSAARREPANENGSYAVRLIGSREALGDLWAAYPGQAAICNSYIEFADIVARWPGSAHDSTIFNNCARRAILESGDGVLLVDGGYASTHYMMASLENSRSPAQNLFNKSQIRSRNVVECLFGIRKKQFPVLALGIRLKLKNIFPVIVATAVVHNLLLQQGEQDPPDDPDLVLPALWPQLLMEGQIAVQSDRRRKEMMLLGLCYEVPCQHLLRLVSRFFPETPPRGEFQIEQQQQHKHHPPPPLLVAVAPSHIHVS
ncbi:Uncharacterized protein GBIM_16266 [Gryllus bimaculatus]|nr:Uncharacterized protein GBIM_16266 [Gryllus bimaculatus]